MPVDQRQAGIGARPHLRRGDDVEDRQRSDTVRVVERDPIRDSPAPIVAGHGKAVMSERSHGLELIVAERPLGVRGVVARDDGPKRVAITG
jgi:hypothetical protein